MADLTESGDRTPRLTRRRGACDHCKIKKIRCNGERPACSMCISNGANCVYREIGRPTSISTSVVATPEPSNLPHKQLGSISLFPQPALPQSLPSPNSVEWNQVAYSSIEKYQNTTDSGEIENYSLTDLDLYFAHDSRDTIVFDDLENIGEGREFNFENTSSTTSNKHQPVFPFLEIIVEEDVDKSYTTTCANNQFLGIDNATINFNPQPRIPSYSLFMTFSQLKCSRSDVQHPGAGKALQDLSTAVENFFHSHDTEDGYIEATTPSEFVTYQEMRTLLEVCMKRVDGVGLLFDFDLVTSAREEIFLKNTSTTPLVTLIFTLIAIGKLIVRGTIEAGRNSSLQCFEIALDKHYSRNGHIKTGLDFQIMVALVYCADLHRYKHTANLLGFAVQSAVAMQLNRIEAVKAISMTVQEQVCTIRAFWFLYAFEKAYCLRWGRVSMLDDDFIDYDLDEMSFLDQQDSPNAHMLRVNYHYAKLCSAIMKRLHGRESWKMDDSTLDKTTKSLHVQIDIWRRNAHRLLEDLSSTPCGISSSDHQMMAIHFSCRYHEAICVIFARNYHIPHPLDEIPWSAVDTSRLRGCMTHIVDIIGLCNRATANNLTPLSLGPLIYLGSLSTCMIFQAVHQSVEIENSSALLAMLLGFFGKLSFTTAVPFEEISTLVRITQDIARLKREKS